MTINVLLPLRTPDSYGAGHFGASRGSRSHNGLDLACYPGTRILAPCDGEVTKLGYPYGDDLSFRYVQITDNQGYDIRVFYVKPLVEVGDVVEAEVHAIGESQDLQARYPADADHAEAIGNHIHLEVCRQEGGDKEYFDPSLFSDSFARVGTE